TKKPSTVGVLRITRHVDDIVLVDAQLHATKRGVTVHRAHRSGEACFSLPIGINGVIQTRPPLGSLKPSLVARAR
ncbi:MAG: hypothetical protein RLY65_501, partial [Pseudomonadota bacterium]